MGDAGRLIARIRRRLRIVRFVDRLQRFALIAAAVVLLVGVGARLTGHHLPLLPALLVAAAVAVAASLATAFLARVPVSRGASEADLILGTRERISSALAVEEGRAGDPLGFYPRLAAEADHVALGVHPARIRRALPLRFRWWGPAAVALAAALLLVPFLPVPGASAEEDSPRAKREREQVVKALKKLERKAARRELEAERLKLNRAAEVAKKIREAAARLAGEKPKKAEAIARLSRLERQVKKSARDAAGLKKEEGESEAATSEKLAELSKALREFEKADLTGTREQLRKLWDKIAEKGAKSLTQAELASATKALEGLRAAMERMAATGGDSEMMRKLLEGLASRESLEKLSQAMQQLMKALKDAGYTEEQLRQMAGEQRDYRFLQLSEEEIEQMTKAMQELMRMLAAGEDIKFCKGGLGGVIPLLLGAGGMFPGGRGNMPGRGKGDDTGGAGQGRGGDPGMTPDGRTTQTDLFPGMVNPDGEASVIGKVRRLPDKEEAPQEYEQLTREASREAEEALRRGDIPRRYRKYVKRFFGTEGE